MVREITTLKQDISTGAILDKILGKETHERLKDFGKDGETYEDVINRLLDFVATEAQRNSSETLKIKKKISVNEASK